MKKSILFFAFILMAYCGFGQASGFTYQAVVRNASGTLVANGSSVGFRISIIDATAAGAVLYQETQNVVVNNTQGLVNLVIGIGTATVGVHAFDPITTTANNNKYLKIEVDPAGGTSYTDMGTVKLEAVPYAAFAYNASVAQVAGEAETASNGFYTSFEHTNTAANTSGHITSLSYPGAASTDRLFVTHRFVAAHLPRLPYSVYWNGGEWTIYLNTAGMGAEIMPLGEKFNVMVIKP